MIYNCRVGLGTDNHWHRTPILRGVKCQVSRANAATLMAPKPTPPSVGVFVCGARASRVSNGPEWAAGGKTLERLTPDVSNPALIRGSGEILGTWWDKAQNGENESALHTWAYLAQRAMPEKVVHPTLGGDLSITFEEFYSAYPRKLCRKDAEKAWTRLSEDEKARAMRALPDHLRAWSIEGRCKQFIPYPATWLNGARWDDELDVEIPVKTVAWWASDEGVLGKGRELHVGPRPGEPMAEYRSRVVEAARRAA